jgi:hypothetical protein
VFTAEIDHLDKARSDYRHLDGIFRKEVEAVSDENGDSRPRIRHAQQLFDAVVDAYSTGLKCQLLLEKNTRYSTKPGNVRAAVDGDNWMVTEHSGEVASGFQFKLERVE